MVRGATYSSSGGFIAEDCRVDEQKLQHDPSAELPMALQHDPSSSLFFIVERKHAAGTATTAPPPLLILAHGSGDNERGLLGLGDLLAPALGGAVVVGLRGTIEFPGFGDAFCWFEG